MSYVKTVKRLFARPERARLLSAADFLKIWEESPEQIKRTRVIPPKLGELGFGKIYVEFNLPVTVIENRKRMKKQEGRVEFV